MTRFARAKGSKASNERTPEDSTPWEVMKEQLVQSKKDSEETKKWEEAEKQRVERYENFLKEHKVQKRKATWCDFPEDQIKKPNHANHTETTGKQKKNNKLSKQAESVADASINSKTDATSPEINNLDGKKKRKRDKKLKAVETELPSASTGLPLDPPKELEDNAITEGNDKKIGKKNKKKNKKKNVISNTNIQEADGLCDNKTEENYIKEPKKDTNANENINKNNKKQNNKKTKKLIDGQPTRRKPINDNSFQLIINGKPVELIRFDGFPIMKKDAERLKELKSNMMKKGIPKSEVQRTLKLERRRAEKALARVKREVCYNCRKGGHNLSDCPDLKSKIPGADVAEGVCFKCGSTEHRQFECKVQRDKEFRFATCFICKEPGHIARQCPDNPKGLYPNGGSCKLCGDVTHLRKDCPTVTDQKEETSIKLQTLDNGDNIEGIISKTNTNVTQETNKKPKKITF